MQWLNSKIYDCQKKFGSLCFSPILEDFFKSFIFLVVFSILDKLSVVTPLKTYWPHILSFKCLYYGTNNQNLQFFFHKK